MLNLRALFQEIPEARQYIESGVLVGSKTVTVYSLAHVQTYVNGDYERGTLKSPFDFSTLPDECTPISKPVAAAESPEGEDSAQPSTPPSTEFIPTTLADLGVDTKRFVVAPEVIIQFEDQILYATGRTGFWMTTSNAKYSPSTTIVARRSSVQWRKKWSAQIRTKTRPRPFVKSRYDCTARRGSAAQRC